MSYRGEDPKKVTPYRVATMDDSALTVVVEKYENAYYIVRLPEELGDFNVNDRGSMHPLLAE